MDTSLFFILILPKLNHTDNIWFSDLSNEIDENNPMKRNKLIVGIGGASGAIYADLLLKKLMHLQDQYEDVGIVYSKNSLINREEELGSQNSIEDYGFKVYENNNFYAPFASGSAKYNTMIVVPCSMGLLGRIATGVSSDLMTRSADVILKERRRLVLVVREAPYNLIHINNMKIITEAGGIICPATPSFYSKPQTIEEVALTVVDRVLDLAGFDISSFRWGND